MRKIIKQKYNGLIKENTLPTGFLVSHLNFNIDLNSRGLSLLFFL